MSFKSKVTKICTSILAVSMAFTCLFATACKDEGGSSDKKEHNQFIEQLGGVSETYKGAVSTQEYETPEAAATAYVETEIAGQNDVNVIKTTSKGTLSTEKVAKLNLPEEISEGITEVEEIEVEYALGEVAPVAAKKNIKVKVYIIKYTDVYKYYTPCPVTGQTITKSYYDSIFNNESYKNCTYTQKSSVISSATAQKQTATVTVTTNQIIKFAENKIYFEQTMSTAFSGNAVAGMTNSSQTIYAYLEENPETGVQTCYVKSSEIPDWTVGDLIGIGFGSLQELTPFYDQYLDYTYFTKTDYGFQLADENARKYLNETFAQAFQGIGLDIDEMNLDMFAKFYVANGVLSGMRQDITGSLSVKTQGMKVTNKLEVVSEFSCTNYGTTVVTSPLTDAE